MDETAWLTETDPEPMLTFLRGKISPRKTLLFVCACWRRVVSLLDERASVALTETEEFIEERLSPEEAGAGGDLIDYANDTVDRFAWSAAFTPLGSADDDGKGYQRERAAQSQLLRDVTGNPFHSIVLRPVWHTPRLLQLAQEAYRDRSLPAGTLRPSRLMALADGLEEAGCADFWILSHFRESCPHVRGCWMLDLILGKK
jgi:hypothetical protein